MVEINHEDIGEEIEDFTYRMHHLIKTIDRPRRKLIIKTLLDHGTLTFDQLVEETGLPYTTCYDNVKELNHTKVVKQCPRKYKSVYSVNPKFLALLEMKLW